jgi:Fe-S cluster assembly protein SufD
VIMSFELPSFISSKSQTQLKEFGLPNSSWENWKYTSIQKIIETPWTPGKQSKSFDISIDKLKDTFSSLPKTVWESGYIIVNGELRSGSSPRYKTESSQKCLVDGKSGPFCVLNYSETLVPTLSLKIPAKEIVKDPIQVVYLNLSNSTEKNWSNPRVMIELGNQSECQVVEWFLGQGEYFQNSVTQVTLGDSAKCVHIKVQKESERAQHVHWIETLVNRAGHYSALQVALGGKMARTDWKAEFLGQGAFAQLNGVSILSQNMHADHHTKVVHKVPNCGSGEVYKAVLKDQSRLVFNGLVQVEPHAIKTDAKQLNSSLMLSRDARVDAKPELEIYADDVKCTHGATVGQLDPMAVFYLKSRGISEEKANGILAQAFVQDLINGIEIDLVRNWVQANSGFGLSEAVS